LDEHEKAEALAKLLADRASESLDYLIRFKLDPFKGNKVYDYMQQKNQVVLNQLAYTYRRLDAEAGQALARASVGESVGTAEGMSLEEFDALKRKKAKYNKMYMDYTEMYARFSQGLKNPDEYVKMSKILSDEPTIEIPQTDTTKQK
jgi:hypothetical protein